MRLLEIAARPGRVQDRRRPAARLHPLATPTTTGSPDRSSTPPAASSGCTRSGSTSALRPRTPTGRSTAGSRSPARAACPPAGLELYEKSRRGDEHGRRPDRRARPRTRPGRRGRDRCRRLAGPRDTRSRALPRHAPRAGERDADLRRPPARAGLDLLRLRPQPGPGRRVPRRARRRSRRSTRSGSASRATAGRSATSRRRSPRTAPRRSANVEATRDCARPSGAETAFEVTSEMLGEAMNPASRRLGAADGPRLPRPPDARGEADARSKAPTRDAGAKPKGSGTLVCGLRSRRSS